MILAFLQLCLVFHSFDMLAGNTTAGISYRFDVYPVENCPMSKRQFEDAAKKMNCSTSKRYLCSPNKNLSSLIEFCTDIRISRYEEGNCVRLEGTGNLNHFNCEDRFSSGCPNASYLDEDIYSYPACLAINAEFNCFVADKECPKKLSSPVTTEIIANATTDGSVGKENNTFKFYQDFYFGVSIFFVYVFLIGTAVIGHIVYIKQKHGEGKTNIETDEIILEKFLSKGYMPIRHVRCIIVGCGGAGKTTLLKRLQNANFKELKDIKTTELVDVYANCFEVLENENTIQSVRNEKEIPTISFPTNLFEQEYRTTETESLQRVAEECQEDIDQTSDKDTVFIDMDEVENDESTSKRDIEHDGEQIQLRPLFENETSPRNEPNPKQFKNTGKENRTKSDSDDFEKNAISKILNAAKSLSYKKRLCPRTTILDFAGQSLYYAFHQIFLSPRTCYILVVDMTKRFEEQVSETDEKCCSRFENWTYQDYYKFWLKSIDSYSDINTPVLLVGTHAEDLSKQDCRRFFREFFAFIDNHPDLRRHLHEDRKFAIGYSEKGSKLIDLVDIKACIANIVQSPAFFDKIQPVWAIFEHILQAEKKLKVVQRKWLSLYKTKLSMTDDNITEMLLFFHKCGKLLYFDKGALKETIILDVQWFLDGFKCIIAYHVNIAHNDCKRLRFKNTGEMDDEELVAIWKTNKEGETYISHKEDILSYMEQLGLLARCYVNKQLLMYYIPSMNRRRFKNPEKQFEKSSILCFQFDKNRQLPFYIFYTLVVKCLNIPEWSILQEDEHTCLYENVACFSFRHCIVVVCLCKFQIQVQVWIPEKGKTIDSALLVEIQRSVEEKINEHNHYIFEIGYKCQLGVLNTENDNSFVALKEFPFSKLTCQKCALKDKHYVDSNVCWIQPRQTTQQDKNISPTSSEKYAFDTRKKSTLPTGDVQSGSRIRNPVSKNVGTVGFFVKSNDDSATPVTGFLTAAHVVIEDLEHMYHRNSFLKDYRDTYHCTIDRKTGDDWEPVGEVVNFIFGNDGNFHIGLDAAFVKTFRPIIGDFRPMSIVDDSLLEIGTTKVIKRNKLTGDSEGLLYDDNTTVRVRFNNQFLNFTNCYQIKDINMDKPFFQKEDGGSAVFVQGENDTLLPLGIAFAYVPSCGSTAVSRIDKILECFNVSIYEEIEDIKTEEN